MKAKTIAMALMLYAGASAQTGMKSHSKSFLESVGEKACKTIENVVSSGVDYADKKLYEARLEDQIEQKIQYRVPDSSVAQLLGYLRLSQEKSAYITKTSSTSASAKVYFSYGLDGLAFAQQYEFHLKNGNITGIESTGNRWIDINGKGHGWNEGMKILHLYDTVIMEWEKREREYEAQNPGEVFSYSRKGIDARGNVGTASMEYRILNKYGTVKDNKVQKVTAEYRFMDGKWQYSDTDFFSSEKNPKKENRGILKDAYDEAKKGISKLKDILWGD